MGVTNGGMDPGVPLPQRLQEPLNFGALRRLSRQLSQQLVRFPRRIVTTVEPGESDGEIEARLMKSGVELERAL